MDVSLWMARHYNQTLVVTTEGRAMLERMNDIRGTDSPPLQALTPSERQTLEKLLGKARTAARAYEAERCAPIQGKAIHGTAIQGTM